MESNDRVSSDALTELEQSRAQKEFDDMQTWLGTFRGISGDISADSKTMVKDENPMVALSNENPDILRKRWKQLRQTSDTFRAVGRGVSGSLPRGYDISVFNDGSVSPVSVVAPVDVI